VTPNPDINGTPVFDAEYVTDGIIQDNVGLQRITNVSKTLHMRSLSV